MEENFLMEMVNLKQGFLPVDLNTGANTGARISMKGCDRVAFILQMTTSTSASVVASFQQHNAATSGTSKALSIANAYYTKAAAETVFTKTVPGASASSFDVSSIFAASGGIIVFEVLAEDLDVTNDFAWISCDVADTTAAKVGACLALAFNNRNNPPYLDAI